MTQEQLAEHFGVSPRTVSRWENGNDLPDLDILIGLADLYEVGIRELIDGERKNGNMATETKEAVLKAAEYMNMGTETIHKARTPASVNRGFSLACGEFDQPHGARS